MVAVELVGQGRKVGMVGDSDGEDGAVHHSDMEHDRVGSGDRGKRSAYPDMDSSDDVSEPWLRRSERVRLW